MESTFRKQHERKEAGKTLLKNRQELEKNQNWQVDVRKCSGWPECVLNALCKTRLVPLRIVAIAMLLRIALCVNKKIIEHWQRPCAGAGRLKRL